MSTHSFKGEIEGYATNYFHKNLWKISATHDLDDAMQEAWFIFRKCDAMYADTEPAHFMALFKTALNNRTMNLAKVATRVRNTVSIHQHDPELIVSVDMEVGETDNAGYLKRLVAQAPAEVKQVLSLFLSAPSEILEAAMDAWQSSGKRGAGGNEHVCKLLGLPAGSKPLDAVQEYFSN